MERWITLPEGGELLKLVNFFGLVTDRRPTARWGVGALRVAVRGHLTTSNQADTLQYET